jgi:hypothetical protein
MISGSISGLGVCHLLATISRTSSIKRELTPRSRLSPACHPSRRQALLAERRPHYVGLDGSVTGDATPATDPSTGITQRRLSNGIRINYRSVGWSLVLVIGRRLPADLSRAKPNPIKHSSPMSKPNPNPTDPRHTDNEPKAGMLRLVMAGGRATESLERGPSGAGAVGVGTRALSESGTAGGWQRQQVRA